MKYLRGKIRILLLFAAGLFLLLILFGVQNLRTYGRRWFSSVANVYLTQKKADAVAGDILDRNGVTLAHTAQDGSRVYQTSAAAREAVAHVLGDTAGHVENAVEEFMAEYLYGFEVGYVERVALAMKGEPLRGDNVKLTIDSALCTYIASVFPNGFNGAVVVMNYRTGELLSLQSFPSFDPMNFDPDNSPADQPTLNRATRWLSAPGSTFKIVTLASALQNLPDAASRTFTCTGGVIFGARSVTDYKNTVHGQLTLKKAFQESCNSTFALLAWEIGDSALRRTAEGFGLNDDFAFRDLVVENSSYPSGIRTDGEIAWTGVGQSALAVTPLHMCMIASAAANGGVMMEPRLLDSVTAASGAQRVSFSSDTYRKALSPDIAETISSDMLAVIRSGTGTAAQVSGHTVCGKTGTAEIDGQEEDNAWFVGFLDEGEYPYAVCVVVENAGSGGTQAAPIAQKIFQYLIRR